MARAMISLSNPTGLSEVGAQWKFSTGYVPGEPNEGLVSQAQGSPARLPEYDDSTWEVCNDLTTRMSRGFSFVWYRTCVTFPEMVGGHTTSGVRVFFETCVDDYGEIWIDGQCNTDRGAIQGFNVPQRVMITDKASPGEQHTIAILAANGPLAAPGGTVFVRYATLAFEWIG